MPDRTTVISYIKITLAPILWGGSLVAGRVVSADLPPLTTTWIRFALVSLFLVPALRIIHGRLPRPTPREAGLLFALTVAGVLLFNLFLFSGLQTITAVRSSVIIAFGPSAIALILAIGFREPAGRNTVIGIVVAFIGAIITITNGDIGTVITEGIAVGDAFLLGCVVSWAAYTILARSAMKTLTPLTILTYSSILGALLLTPLAIHRGGIAELGAQGIGTWAGILYLSFGAAGFAYLFYYEGIRDIGANETAIFLNLEPVSAIILGVVLLGEVLTGPVIAGAVLVIIGLYLVNRPERPRAT